MTYFLSPYSLAFLSNGILALVIGLVFASGGIRSAAAPILILSFFSQFLLSLIWLGATLTYSAVGSKVAYLFLLHLVFYLILIQLVYRYPRHEDKKESAYTLLISFVVLLLALPDYLPVSSEFSFEIHARVFRLPRSMAVQFVFALWCLVILLRKSQRISRRQLSFTKTDPSQGLPKRIYSLRLLVLLFAFMAFQALLHLAVALRLIAPQLFLPLFVCLLLSAQVIYAYVYLTYSKEPVSFLVKVVGLSLVGIIFVVQLLLYFTVSWVEEKYNNEKLVESQDLVEEITHQQELVLPSHVDFIFRELGEEKKELVYIRFGYPPQENWKNTLASYGPKRYYIPIDEPTILYRFEKLGSIWGVGFSYKSYRQYIHEYLIRFAILLLLLVVLVIVVLPTLFYFGFMKPLRVLVSSLEYVRRGQLKVNIPVTSHDELGFLTHSFNRMVLSLQRADERLRRYTERLEDLVEKRTFELKLRMREIEETNIALQNEIKERRHLEAKLRENQKFIQSIAQSSPQVLFLYDIKEKTLRYLNNETFHVSDNPIPAPSGFWGDIIHPEDRSVYENWLEQLKKAKDNEPVDAEFRIRGNNGHAYWIFTRAIVYSRESDGTVRDIIGTSIDVTQRKLAEERVLYLARHDPLTGLPNRLRLQERFAEMVAHCRGQKIALLFLDLDRFKWVNDTLGHETGDQLLKSVAEKLRLCVREQDMLSRWGGDEFVVLLMAKDIYTFAEQIASCMLRAIETPFNISGQEVLIHGSIGIAIYPDHDVSLRNLLRKADLAMYLAKEKGRANHCFYETTLEHKTEHFRRMEIEIRRGLENDEFFMQYQPIYSIDQEKLVGVESLLRWRHREKGIIYPSEFLEIAEETGQILELGRVMLKRVLVDASKWLELGYEIPVTFNISNRQFRSENISKMVQEVLIETKFPPEFLELELTEGILFDASINAEKQLESLRKLGVKLSLDDFGTGHTSLGYLKKISVSKLKIDKSFVSDLGSGVQDEPFVAAIVALARALKLPTVAEGVEREEQLHYLRQVGVDYIQGFLFGRPMDIDTFLELLKKKKPPFARAYHP
ncbi:MAG: EAL domain-containing protein [Leptospiraceae bacterium]|nr:EAL domain-containing protein [Leptospiraceae bacterium]MDW8306230.1 EAL domain-containing protein [Leptospiraceae bacterium]